VGASSGGKVLRFLSKVYKEADLVLENIFTEVFQKDVVEYDFTYKDAVITGLIENILNHTKSIIILIENSHHTSLDSLLRTIFENYVHLRYILKDDSELRAKSYVYSTRLSEFQMIDKLKEQSLIGRKIRDFVRVSLEQITQTYQSKTDPSRRERIEKRYINDIGMKRLEQKWYNLDGKTNSFKKLCKSLDLEAEYEIVYSILSKEVHGKDAVDKLEIQKYYVGVKNSDAKDTELHISLLTLYLIELVRLIYKHYGMTNRLKHFNTMLRLHKRY